MYSKIVLEHLNEISSPGGGGSSSGMPCHFTYYLFQVFPDKTYVKKYQYEERYRPLKFHICIEMTGKCKFQMALNPTKIDYSENVFWRDRELMYFKNIFGAFQLHSFPGERINLACHVISPTIYSKHSQTKNMYKISILREI